VSTVFSKDETNWLVSQAKKLKLLWSLLSKPNCSEVMRRGLKAVAELNNCNLDIERIENIEWTILACSDYVLGASGDVPSTESYVDWLVTKGAFSVGVDIVFTLFFGKTANCHVRVFKQPPPKIKFPRRRLEYLISDVSLMWIAAEKEVWNLTFTVSRIENSARYPPVEIYLVFREGPKLYGYDTSVGYEEPVEPMTIIKAITRSQEVRSKIEEAVNELVTRVIKIYTPYLLY